MHACVCVHVCVILHLEFITFLSLSHSLLVSLFVLVSSSPPTATYSPSPGPTPLCAPEAKGEDHPVLNPIYRVPNMHSDRNAKEPGSFVWQSEHILMCSDGTSSYCPHLREAHPCALRTQAFLAHPPTVLHPSRAPHTQLLHPSMGSLTQGSTFLGVLHAVLLARLR